MTQLTRTIPVKRRALLARINRALRKDGKALRVSRPRARSFVGDHYVLNIYSNGIVEQYVDPEQLGRRLGVLNECERPV